MALAKAPDSQTLQDLARRVMTPVERPLHHKLLAEAGLTLDHAQNAVRSPANTAYVDRCTALAPPPPLCCPAPGPTTC
jgi:thiaminase